MKRNGFTLVELLIVMAILATLSVIMIATINPMMQSDKGTDARRKKDINRIKVAFEEYHNDKGCFPPQIVVDQLMNDQNCGNVSVFSPWLSPWPCDPDKVPYIIVVENDSSNCPGWFKVLTKLKNKNDRDIPEKLKSNPQFFKLGSGVVYYNATVANFGTSSTNVNWADFAIPDSCVGSCSARDVNGICNAAVGHDGSRSCSGGQCYMDSVCNPECQVSECPLNY